MQTKDPWKFKEISEGQSFKGTKGLLSLGVRGVAGEHPAAIVPLIRTDNPASIQVPATIVPAAVEPPTAHHLHRGYRKYWRIR
ncbi:hypothetical protein BMS3Abin15_00932 [bacterium BMS3Abin15]|nr:hypothetical protein BMS3Abin15_00932 [bacterium BMS3Abin15]